MGLGGRPDGAALCRNLSGADACADQLRVPAAVRSGPNFPWRQPKHEYLAEWEAEALVWGTEASARAWLEAQGQEPTFEAVRERARRDRLCISPGALIQLARMNAEIDVRSVLSTISVPTLVLHRREDPVPIDGARWMAEQIPGARFVELPGGPHMPYYGDWAAVVDAIRAFVESVCLSLLAPTTGCLPPSCSLISSDRPPKPSNWATAAGANCWSSTMRGPAPNSGGFAASSWTPPATASSRDSTGPPAQCAVRAIRDSVSELGVDLRAGLHTGECEIMDGKVAGIAVSIGARVAAHARAGDVLVSQTVRDLVAGSGIEFADRGPAQLKGIPGDWKSLRSRCDSLNRAEEP